jgi:hypothetical protein
MPKRTRRICKSKIAIFINPNFVSAISMDCWPQSATVCTPLVHIIYVPVPLPHAARQPIVSGVVLFFLFLFTIYFLFDFLEPDVAAAERVRATAASVGPSLVHPRMPRLEQGRYRRAHSPNFRFHFISILKRSNHWSPSCAVASCAGMQLASSPWPHAVSALFGSGHTPS